MLDAPKAAKAWTPAGYLSRCHTASADLFFGTKTVDLEV
jgi:hypothetical protein